MSGGGKGGSQSQSSTQKVQVELDPDLKKGALEALAGGFRTASMPYAPYDAPAIAGFTPEEMAAFQGAGQAAQAFGLPSSMGTSPDYLPAPQNVGGFQGYSPKPIYDEAMGNLPPGYEAMQKAILANYGQSAENIIPSTMFEEALKAAYPDFDFAGNRPPTPTVVEEDPGETRKERAKKRKQRRQEP